MTASVAHPSTFRPDIEGLRAVAVLPVVAFHLDPRIAPGGFVGVDVFFVISGYLISGLLLQRMANGRLSILDFYAARIRRIFPALFVMLAACVLAGALCLSPDDYAELGVTVVATSLYYSNYQFNSLVDYFGGAAELKPLLHTWSLAVEEQFYVAFPLLLLTLRNRSTAVRTFVFVAIALLSLAYSIRVTSQYPGLAFYSAFTRAFELMVGAIAALYRTTVLPHTARQALAAGGLGLIAWSLAFLSAASAFPGWRAAIPTIGVALLLVAGQGTSPTFVGRLLSARLLRWFGMLSYSLYLWHWPVIVFFRHLTMRAPEGYELLLCALLATGLAYASFRLVETPFRTASLRRRTVLWVGVLMMVGGVLAGTLLQAMRGFPQRFDATSMAYFAGRGDLSPERKRCHANNDELISYDQRCRFGSAETPAGSSTVAVWADSHGTELALALGRIEGGRPVLQISSSGCPPATGYVAKTIPKCAERNQESLERLASDQQVDTVVIASYFDHHLERNGQSFRSGLETSIATLRKAGKRVIIVAPFPHFRVPVPVALGMMHMRTGSAADLGLSSGELDRQRREAMAFIARLARNTGAEIFDPASVLCDSTRCAASEGLHVNYFDEHHISMHAARRVARALAAMWATRPISVERN